MFTATAAAVTLSAASTATTPNAFEPGFFLMLLLVLGGIAGTVTVGWQNHRRRHR